MGLSYFYNIETMPNKQHLQLPSSSLAYCTSYGTDTYKHNYWGQTSIFF